MGCFNLRSVSTEHHSLLFSVLLQWLVLHVFGSLFSWISYLFLSDLQESHVYSRLVHLAESCLSAFLWGLAGYGLLKTMWQD